MIIEASLASAEVSAGAVAKADQQRMTLNKEEILKGRTWRRLQR